MNELKKEQIVLKSLSDLRRPERNARLHPDKQIAELKRSLEKNGQTRLMVIDENNVIWIGNGLYQAMTEMGYEKAYCIVKAGMSENDKKKLMLTDNRIFDLGVDDMKVFDEFVIELGEAGDLDIPGFDDDLLESLVADASDVDEMMSSYGLIDDQKKEQIQAAAETYEKEAEVREEQSASAPAPEQRVGRHVVCPKCGETIWL